MPSCIHLYRSINKLTRELTFLIEIDLIIVKVYDSLAQEFFTIDEVKNHVLHDLDDEGDQLLRFMSYGLNYLAAASNSEFYDVVSDIEFDGSSLEQIKDYVMENIKNRFAGYLAYALLSETDIEDFLDKPNFKLVNIHYSFITFSYQRSRVVMNIIDQHYQG